MEAVRAGVVAAVGALGTIALVRAARRFAVSDRLRDVRPARTLPGFIARPVADALDAAAVDCSVDQAVQMWLMAILVAGLLGTALAGPAGVVFAAGVALAGPVGLRLARDRSRRRVAAAVPDALERVASELRAGGTIATAVEALARSESVLAKDLARVEARARLGASLGDALRVWVNERRAAGVEAAGGALALCAKVGGQSADALDGLASSLRERLGVLAEARALSSQARMSALVIGLAPVAYLVCSTAFDDRTTHLLFATRLGQLCLAAGLTLEVLGGWWMRRIVSAGDDA
jgi:tight adherence protein B